MEDGYSLCSDSTSKQCAWVEYDMITIIFQEWKEWKENWNRIMSMAGKL